MLVLFRRPKSCSTVQFQLSTILAQPKSLCFAGLNWQIHPPLLLWKQRPLDDLLFLLFYLHAKKSVPPLWVVHSSESAFPANFWPVLFSTPQISLPCPINLSLVAILAATDCLKYEQVPLSFCAPKTVTIELWWPNRRIENPILWQAAKTQLLMRPKLTSILQDPPIDSTMSPHPFWRPILAKACFRFVILWEVKFDLSVNLPKFRGFSGKLPEIIGLLSVNSAPLRFKTSALNFLFGVFRSTLPTFDSLAPLQSDSSHLTHFLIKFASNWA